jgi:hypothetical protein
MAMMIGFNAGWPTTEAAVTCSKQRLRSTNSDSLLLGNPIQWLPKPSKMPPIPMSAILSDGLLVPAQQGPDTGAPPPTKTSPYILLDEGLEVGGTPKSADIDES